MKRHPALAELSRDHHQALVVAQRLKRADAESVEEARAAFFEFWKREGADHFREEEEILLPAVARFTDPHQVVIARVLTEHVAIRSRAGEVAEGADVEALRALGGELERHVRHEERELFPLIEHVMPEEELVALAETLTRS